jgi:hypothetical protein
MIPCISHKSLKLLTGTADERYTFSPQFFRDTHFPQVMREYVSAEVNREVTEGELLQQLKQEETYGNRLFFIYGSTGSGKSELLCWLRDQWLRSDCKRPVIRISRTEMNPQILIKKCYETLGLESLVSIQESKWDLLIQKPITIINQIVWTGLSEHFEHDEQIVPLALMIRPMIEKNVLEFTKQVKNMHVHTPLQIISESQFDEMKRQTSLIFELDFKTLQHTLIEKMDQFLFEGQTIGMLFRQLHQQVIRAGVRPLLLIDDLVQSVNLYAADLMDQLFTLEEGAWDVVLGLTPGFYQDFRQQQTLNNRLQYLDTIDDRVRKLWISDESGKTFYNINREKAVDYIRRYMHELKKSNGWTCGSACPNVQQCQALLVDREHALQVEDEQRLLQTLPLNPPLIRRMYDGIAEGKGKLRYMILRTKEVTQTLMGGGNRILQTIGYFHRELFAEHEDKVIKTLAELFAYENRGEVRMNVRFCAHFVDKTEDMTVSLYKLGEQSANQDEGDVDSGVAEVHTEAFVRDWVEGKNLNLNLLDQTRVSVATLIHDVTKATSLKRPYTARQGSLLSKMEVEHRTRYPLSFGEEKTAKKSIVIPRRRIVIEIGNYSQLTTPQKVSRFKRFVRHQEVADWFYQTEALQVQWKMQLHQLLGCSLEWLAWQLKESLNAWKTLEEYAYVKQVERPLNAEFFAISQQLFEDWYLLRDNVVDSRHYPLTDVEGFAHWLQMYQSNRELETFYLGKQSVNQFFLQLKEEWKVYSERLSEIVNRHCDDWLSWMANVPEGEHSASVEKKQLYSLSELHEYGQLERSWTSHFPETEWNLLKMKQVERVQLLQQVVRCDKKIRRLATRVGVVIGENEHVLDGSLDALKQLYVEQQRLIWFYESLPASLLSSLESGSEESQFCINSRMLWQEVADCYEQMLITNSESSLKDAMDGWYKRVNKLIIKEFKWDEKVARKSKKIRKEADLFRRAVEQYQLRPYVLRHFEQLLDAGKSRVPLAQLVNLLALLKRDFPNIYSKLEVELRIK